MGAFALPAVLTMMAAGTATSAVGAHGQGEAAKNAARFNKRIAARETAEQVETAISDHRRQRSTNITRVAKSGVRLSGSPLAVIENNAFNAEKRRRRIQEAGAIRGNLFDMRARSARQAGRLGIASSVLGGGAQMGALALTHA